MVTSTSSGGGITTQVTGAGGLEAGMAPFHVDEATLARAAAGETVAIETTIGSAPVRIVAGPVNAVGGPDAAGPAPAGSRPALSVGVVIGDRTAELDTLRTLLLVLLGGGLVVLFASITAGYFYAGRALVPIRDALSRQREFAADASHELRTPLAITRAAVAAARLGREEPDVVDGALDDIDAGVDRMASLVDDLLLLARADAEAVELALGDTDLGLAAAEAAEALEPLAATRGIRIALDVRPAPVRGDERRLRQLAGILVDNAIRHSPDGGTVGVTVRDGAVLVVEDEGAGIPPEHVERVFERFWRAPGSPSGGTGLGLAIARWIAERHGGSITASQRSGPGAAFTVRLPEARDPHRG
jgi:signal transduction histidine kinase